MSSLANKHILLGVTGGIAAYKSADLIRRLQDLGAEVRVVMTSAAQEFITPLTLQALSGNPVHTSLLDPEAEAAMGHIQLARWADLILVVKNGHVVESGTHEELLALGGPYSRSWKAQVQSTYDVADAPATVV